MKCQYIFCHPPTLPWLFLMHCTYCVLTTVSYLTILKVDYLLSGLFISFPWDLFSFAFYCSVQYFLALHFASKHLPFHHYYHHTSLLTQFCFSHSSKATSIVSFHYNEVLWLVGPFVQSHTYVCSRFYLIIIGIYYLFVSEENGLIYETLNTSFCTTHKIVHLIIN